MQLLRKELLTELIIPAHTYLTMDTSKLYFFFLTQLFSLSLSLFLSLFSLLSHSTSLSLFLPKSKNISCCTRSHLSLQLRCSRHETTPITPPPPKLTTAVRTSSRCCHGDQGWAGWCPRSGRPIAVEAGCRRGVEGTG